MSHTRADSTWFCIGASPHPALRATFSRKGRRESGDSLLNIFSFLIGVRPDRTGGVSPPPRGRGKPVIAAPREGCDPMNPSPLAGERVCEADGWAAPTRKSKGLWILG
jgi:hypothetical protein